MTTHALAALLTLVVPTPHSSVRADIAALSGTVHRDAAGHPRSMTLSFEIRTDFTLARATLMYRPKDQAAFMKADLRRDGVRASASILYAVSLDYYLAITSDRGEIVSLGTAESPLALDSSSFPAVASTRKGWIRGARAVGAVAAGVLALGLAIPVEPPPATTSTFPYRLTPNVPEARFTVMTGAKGSVFARASALASGTSPLLEIAIERGNGERLAQSTGSATAGTLGASVFVETGTYVVVLRALEWPADAAAPFAGNLVVTFPQP